jgi:excisionase family DNA binding protein
MKTQFVTVDEIAKRLSVHEESVRRWLRAGRFPNAIKLPEGRGDWRIPVTDVAAFLKANKKR